MAWYDSGNISLTNGSTTVTGSGTDFISGAQIGEALYAPDGKLYEIQSITSATVLVLADSYLGSTASGQDYKIIPTQSLVADLASDVTDLIADYADVKDKAGAGKFNDGSVTAPAITFEQDQNNGLYRIGSDNYGFSAGGTKQIDISTTDVELNHSGSKKLATTSTGVDVTGTVTADGLTVSNTGANIYLTSADTGQAKVFFGGASSNEKGSIRYSDNSDWMRFYTDSKLALELDSNGNVEFFEDTGTTAKMVWSSSAESLGIGAGVFSQTQALNLTGEGIAIKNDRDGSDNNWSLIRNTATNSGSNISFVSGTGEAMVIAHNGNVGIGDTAPERKLHVNSGSTNECALFESTDTEVTLALKDSTGTAEIKSRNDFRFNTGGSERARITTEGTFDLAYKNLGSIATYTDTTYRHRDTFANLFFTTPADNVWRNVCAINDSYGTFTVTGSDTPSGDVAQYAYRITTVSYGVSMFSQVFYKEGGWNTGTFEFRVANVGGTQTLQMRYSSYYSSSNTGSFYINFNSLG